MTSSSKATAPDIGEYQSQLWRAADTLRGNIDAADYKHVVLPLIFLKYISDAFEELHEELKSQAGDGVDPEEPDYYKAKNVFWVPQEARWSTIQAQARQETNGATIDQAMTAIERDNQALRGVLPKDYGRDGLDKQRLGEVIDLVSNIKVGGANAQATDALGRVYEYFLEQFAMAEGRKGGEFYTPRSVVRLLVEMIEPYRGRVYDPCCGSAGMFIQSIRFIEAHATGNGNGGRAQNQLSIYGQESNQTTWRLAQMNLAIRGIEGQVEYGDSFRNDRHPDLKADYILANPPFNVKEWQGDQLREDKRWAYGIPPCRERQLRLGPAFPAPPIPQGHRGIRPRQRVDVIEHFGRGGDPEEHHRGRLGGLHHRPTRDNSSGQPRYRPVSGSSAGDGGNGRARPCSSTPASWATWPTEPTGTWTPEEISRDRRHLPCLER